MHMNPIYPPLRRFETNEPIAFHLAELRLARRLEARHASRATRGRLVRAVVTVALAIVSPSGAAG